MVAKSHEAIQRDPDYKELVRRRSSFGWTLSLIMLVIYFGFILLVAYAPKFLGTPSAFRSACSSLSRRSCSLASM
jgi:uncharacterized membrane protein (DUF485 family)